MIKLLKNYESDTIYDAIDFSSNGSIIIIDAGTYNETETKYEDVICKTCGFTIITIGFNEKGKHRELKVHQQRFDVNVTDLCNNKGFITCENCLSKVDLDLRTLKQF